MKAELIYVELKTDFSDDGSAWIGMPAHSKSGATIYFNGLALKSLKGAGVSANYYELQSGDEYWVSGVKLNGEDRHYAGGGDVFIDKLAVEKYLKATGLTILPKNLIVTELKPSKPGTEHHEYENGSLSEEKEAVLGWHPITKTLNRLKE